MPAANAEAFARPKPWPGCPNCGQQHAMACYYDPAITSRYTDLRQQAYDEADGYRTVVGTPIPHLGKYLYVTLLETVNSYNWHLDGQVTYCPSCGWVRNTSI